ARAVSRDLRRRLALVAGLVHPAVRRVAEDGLAHDPPFVALARDDVPTLAEAVGPEGMPDRGGAGPPAPAPAPPPPPPPPGRRPPRLGSGWSRARSTRGPSKGPTPPGSRSTCPASTPARPRA